jgi:hypothetical protein
MNDLHNRLSVLKMILNTPYGVSFSTATNVYEESYKIRKKIHSIKVRKEKIKRIFNG